MKLYCSRLKSSLIGALALLMILTSTAMAMGQLRAAAVGEMVLCTGHGPRVVQIDAHGQPAEPQVVCPDCLTELASLKAEAPATIFPASFLSAHFSGRDYSKYIPRPNGSSDTTRAPPAA